MQDKNDKETQAEQVKYVKLPNMYTSLEYFKIADLKLINLNYKNPSFNKAK
jgi:hypothetical protein